MKKDENLKKQNVLTSVGTKISIVTISAVVITCATVLLLILPSMQTLVSGTAKDNMHALAEAYGVLIDDMDGGYGDVLEHIKVQGVSDSYAYLVDAEGTMLYHPTTEKIGDKVENIVVSGIVQDLKDGKKVESNGVEYDYKGEVKYAGYAVLEGNMILVITGSEKAAMSGLDAARNKTIVASIFIGIIICIIMLLIVLTISNAIKKITNTIYKISEFDYTTNDDLPKLCKRKDEIGKMANAVQVLLDNMRGIIAEMNHSATSVTELMVQVNEVSNRINVSSTENSATTEELAAGMEETTATTTTIEQNIYTMNEKAQAIDDLAVKSGVESNEVLLRAQQLKETTEKSTEVARGMYEAVKTKTNEAIEDAKAVEKINELTEVIMEISSQTSLLALNASIEAARAGEAGRGFAVVAEEIGSLAVQTSDTVTNIGAIVKDVNATVKKMQGVLTDTIYFLENTVFSDYKSFEEVGEKYDEDAISFKNNMGTVQESIESLLEVIQEISLAVTGINNMVNESAIGITDIADKTSDTVIQTERNYELVNECTKNADQLKEIVERFKQD